MKIIKIIFFIFIIINNAYANEDFENWLNSFTKTALDQGISQETVSIVLKNAKFLPNVIKYDRYQPEFYEDTKTYIGKRVTNKRINNGSRLYAANKNFINEIEKKFSVEKELLLSLMAIETNYGKYLGKMDIISSLATLSFDKRRSEFFTNELLIALRLIDKKLIDHKILYGSWAGAFGNFQFMPRTIRNHAIDYNNNNIVELKKTEDSFASAANYLKNIGWELNKPCFKNINLKKNIPKKYLNSSARKLKNKKKLSYFKKYIENFKINENLNNLMVAIIIPDKDIIPGAENLSPAYLVFENYERILSWNRSLRFALAVCTLKEKFENEI